MVSFALDDFIRDKDSTYWKAELSDGTFVYQDDGRPGLEPNSAWLRLKTYCEANGLFPRRMWVVFRSHTEFAGESDTGFYFSLGIMGSPGMRKCQQRFICGPIVDGEIKVKIWQVPEVLEIESETRPLVGNEEKTIMCSSH